jgi:hypothetical protein
MENLNQDLIANKYNDEEQYNDTIDKNGGK